MNGLVCEGITLRYERSEPVISSLSLTLEPGLWAMVGPNGAGKSTLLRALAGLHAPEAGRVLLKGEPVHRMAARHRATRIAYVPQRSSVWAGFDVRTIVAMGRHALPRRDETIERALDGVALLDRAEEPYRSLSVGQQQRVTIARALAQLDGSEGGVLVADEPLSAQDPAFAARVMGLLRGHVERGGLVVAALHDCTTALRCADGGVLLSSGGTLVTSGPAVDTFTPGWMERVFGVGFDLVRTPGGPALLPRGATMPL